MHNLMVAAYKVSEQIINRIAAMYGVRIGAHPTDGGTFVSRKFNVPEMSTDKQLIYIFQKYPSIKAVLLDAMAEREAENYNHAITLRVLLDD